MDGRTTERQSGPNMFWPMFFMALALAVMLGWNLTIVIRQYVAGLRMLDRQMLASVQAVQVEERLKSLLTDLIELSKTDPDAKDIVVKYRVTSNVPQQPLQAVPPAPSTPKR